MGCGPSQAAVAEKVNPVDLTPEQLEQLKAEGGVGQDFSGGEWWWGHPFGSKEPEDCGTVVKAATELLPAYHRDVLRLKACPTYMDHQAKKNPQAKCPFMAAQFHLGHSDVQSLLKQCPHKHLKGEITRENELGYLLLADGAFPPDKTIGLGAPVDKHRTVRGHLMPLIERMPGFGGIMAEVQTFLAGRTKISLPDELDHWWCRMMWKHMLSKELTVKESQDFVSFRGNWLMAAVAQMGDISLAHLTFKMDDLTAEQDKHRNEIKRLLPPSVPEEARASVAQGVLEMICFAGGLSVPQTCTSALAALFQDFMKEPITADNVVPFVYEVTRLFPAVQGFAYWTKDRQRHVLSLNAALRDPKAWGKDSDRFTLKDVKLYKEKHVGFAQQAVAPDARDSKACPGIPVALETVQAVVLAFATWAPDGQRLDSVWRPVGKIEPAGKPTWWQPFTLERVPKEDKHFYEDLLDRNHSGEDSLARLSPSELSALLDKIDKDRDGSPDLLKKLDNGTWLFYKGLLGSSTDKTVITEIDLPRGPAVGAYDDSNSMLMPFGGIRLPKRDEQWSGQPWLEALAFNFLKVVNWWEDDKIPPELYVSTEEKRKEAIAIGQQAFSRGPNKTFLPLSKAPFNDLSSDKAQGIIARYGMGQLYLKRNADASRAELGDIICDLSSLANFEVRKGFERLGAVAYFKQESNGDFAITAVDWKCGLKIVKPGDAAWEHAKFVWRCSAITTMTAINHLTYTHWVQGNALKTALKEAFGPNHPLRRLMHVNQFNTAFINVQSYQTLFPENGFLHHISSFTYPALEGVFKAAIEAFEYKTLPQQFKDMDLPDEVKSKLPMFEDGLPLWKALRDFFGKYLDLYYPSDEALLADPEVKVYWEFKSCPPYKKGLPALSKSSLADQLAQVCFDVIATHEFVGSVAGYVADPSGAFLQVRPGQDMADIQQLIQTMTLTAATGKPMPLYIDDWKRMLDLGASAKVNKFKEASVLWDSMKADLVKLGQQVDERNKTRSHPFPHYHPAYLECSVNL
mmetsp:Transcript_22280/g.50957  ORF Transcript_22280/g.50957 Transcript_22280/m.50957 type:complete len:1024 (+) Transcript_22280:80-3151(+)